VNTETNPTRVAMTEAEAEAKARQIIADFATSYRDDTPVPAVGSAAPVPQPGRPPMSQRATDASALMLSAGVASLPIGGSVSLVLYTLGHVDPTSLAIGAAAPVALVLAIGGLLRRAKSVLPEEHHHHYEGPVYQDQRNVHSHTRGVWAKTTNTQ
jgi:hypothetical protein